MATENIKSEEIFHEAIELSDPGKRSAYLDKACGKDSKLRAEVEALLRAHEEAGSLLTGNWLSGGGSFSITLLDQTGYDSVYSNINFVPEPATLLILGLGGLMLRRRK